MDRELVIDTIRQHAHELRRRGVDALYLFGSTARREAGSESDVDLFIDYDPNARFSLFDLMRMQDFLTDALKSPVDLTTRNGLHPLIRADVVDEAVRIL